LICIKPHNALALEHFGAGDVHSRATSIPNEERTMPMRGLAANGILVICAAAAMWPTTVAAQPSGAATAASNRVVARQCEVDLRARCAVVTGAEPNIRACLKQQLDSVADECRAWLVHLAAIDQACAADVKQTCANVQRGQGRIEACLRSAGAKLSDACKDGLAKTISSRR
jgi:hypothetical protein